MAQMRRNGEQDDEYEKQIKAAYKDLVTLLSSNKQFAPTVLRLAFHDAGTYDAATNTGGANGSVRNELNTAPNKHMDIVVTFLEQVKRKRRISYADFYQLAGVAAVEVCGGPRISFVPGRKDAPKQQDPGTLPNPTGGSQHLKDTFHRMGLSDKDIVVLSGAHTLGRAHQDRSGFDGPFTRDPLKFDNSYFVELMKGDTKGLVKFPSDKALLQDPAFLPFVQLYARDEKAFFKDYAVSHKKMSELGFNTNQKHSLPFPRLETFLSHNQSPPHHTKNNHHSPPHHHNNNHHSPPHHNNNNHSQFQCPFGRPQGRPRCGFA